MLNFFRWKLFPQQTYRLFRDKLKRLSFSANETKSSEQNMAIG